MEIPDWMVYLNLAAWTFMAVSLTIINIRGV